jgi:hypothetical protein
MCSRIVLFRYAGQANNLVKYIKLAALLPEKTVRDVALRCIWITKKEDGERRKVEEQNSSKKTKDKKEKAEAQVTRPLLEVGARVPPPMYTPPSTPVDNDDGISNDGGFQFFSSVSFFSHSLQGSVTGRQKLRYFLLEKAFF